MSDPYVPSGWQNVAARGDWLEAAKLAVLDQAALKEYGLTCATIALTEALLKAIEEDE